jgi:hypothetical protein
VKEDQPETGLEIKETPSMADLLPQELIGDETPQGKTREWSSSVSSSCHYRSLLHHTRFFFLQPHKLKCWRREDQGKHVPLPLPVGMLVILSTSH